jgi:hypothetical protein
MEGCARKCHFRNAVRKSCLEGYSQRRVYRDMASTAPNAREVAKVAPRAGRDMTCRHDWHHLAWRTSEIAAVPASPTSHAAADVNIEIERMAQCLDQSAYHSPAVLRLRHYACNEDTNPIRPIVGNFETQWRPNCGFRLRAQRRAALCKDQS